MYLIGDKGERSQSPIRQQTATQNFFVLINKNYNTWSSHGQTSMLANGSKFSLEIQLLQSSPPVVKTTEVTETWLEV